MAEQPPGNELAFNDFGEVRVFSPSSSERGFYGDSKRSLLEVDVSAPPYTAVNIIGLEGFSPCPSENPVGTEVTLFEKRSASSAGEDAGSSVSESQPTIRAFNQLGKRIITEPSAVDEEP